MASLHLTQLGTNGARMQQMPNVLLVTFYSLRPQRNIKIRICGIRTFLQTPNMCGDVKGLDDKRVKELFETGKLIEVLQMVGPQMDGTPTSITIKKTSRTGTSIVLQKRCEFHLVLMTL